MSERSDSIAEMKRGKVAVEIEIRDLVQAFIRKYGVEVERVDILTARSHGLPPVIASVNLDVRIP